MEMTIREYAVEIANVINANTEFEARMCDVTKNNGVTYIGVTVKEPGDTIAPNIYINKMYDDGIRVKDAVEYVLKMYMENRNPGDINADDLTNWSKVKDKVRVRIVAKSSYLDDKVSKDYLDLALMYYISLGNGENGAMSAPITQAIFNRYGISRDELHRVAVANTKANDPCFGRSMRDTIAEMMGDDVPEFMLPPDDGMMTVYSNKNKMHGAIALLIADFGREPRYILPSSIHEVLSIKPTGDMDVQTLKDMVRDVNDTQVAPDEILSYSVYFWDGNGVSVVA